MAPIPEEPDWKYMLSLRLTESLLVLATLAATIGILLGKDLYYAETESIRAQVFGQDLVILIFVIPVLAWSMVSATRGSVRGRLAWIALLFFFVYTYLSYVMLFTFNRAFLLHVTLTAIALYALALNLASLDVSSVRVDTSKRIVKYTPHVLGFLLVMILLLWLPEIISSTVLAKCPLGSSTTVSGPMSSQPRT